MDPRTPVIVGAGQFVHRDDAAGIPNSPEPVDLMAEALRVAEASTGTSGVLGRLQSISVVPVVSWRYGDPGRLVGERIGASPDETVTAAFGGNTPTQMLNRAARMIAAGQLDSAAVVGGEAYRTRMGMRRDGGKPEWTVQPDDAVATDVLGADQPFFHPVESARGIVMPIQTYPMFENALRHERGESFAEHQAWVAQWWAGFSQVAAENPYSWYHRSYTPDEITTVTDDNRMVSLPYCKRMVSNPNVDTAAGVVVMSVEAATAAGISSDRWVFVHAGTDGSDPFPTNRADFVSSAAMRVAGRRCLELSGFAIDDIDLLDVYSCFPSAVQIAAKEIGIDLGRELTLYGGLCFAGGPWNNPVSHALATAVDRLRNGDGRTALITANGGIVAKHGFVVLGTEPPAAGFRWEKPQAEIDTAAGPLVEAAAADAAGPVTIEAWTVAHGRTGEPESAHATVRFPDGTREWALTSDAATVTAMADGTDWCDTPAHRSADAVLSL